jgi:hypothetical protein
MAKKFYIKVAADLREKMNMYIEVTSDGTKKV